MDDRSRNIAVGLTALVGLVGVLGMMLLFGYLPEMLQQGYIVHVRLPRAAGLHPGSRVFLSGIDVGQVESVHLLEPAGAGVVANTRISPGVRIPERSRVTVESKLLGGTPTLSFSPAQNLDPEPEFLEPGETIKGSVPTLTSTLGQELQMVLEEPMDEFRRIAESFETLSEEWTRVGEQVNRLIEPRTVEQVEAGTAEPNLTTTIARLDRRLTEIDRTIQGINRYVNDEDLRTDIRTAASNARELTEQMQEAVDEMQGQITSDVDALRARYIALADDMSAAVNSLRQLSEQARAGEGTLGRLVQDPALYNNLEDTVQRLQKAIDEMRLLIQKWKAEGLPVQF